jgi:hypothetical protein
MQAVPSSAEVVADQRRLRRPYACDSRGQALGTVLRRCHFLPRNVELQYFGRVNTQRTDNKHCKTYLSSALPSLSPSQVRRPGVNPTNNRRPSCGLGESVQLSRYHEPRPLVDVFACLSTTQETRCDESERFQRRKFCEQAARQATTRTCRICP